MTKCNKPEKSEVLSNVVNALITLIHVHKHITVQKTENPNIKIAISTTNETRQEYKGCRLLSKHAKIKRDKTINLHVI
jgi:hypothetical protein